MHDAPVAVHRRSGGPRGAGDGVIGDATVTVAGFLPDKAARTG
ncbi:hypothetical protein OR263_15690 [Streptomyces sp. NEAU-H22]|nr:hypothetical protein [Streptomyces sp. NEAU-H22]